MDDAYGTLIFNPSFGTSSNFEQLELLYHLLQILQGLLNFFI